MTTHLCLLAGRHRVFDRSGEADDISGGRGHAEDDGQRQDRPCSDLLEQEGRRAIESGLKLRGPYIYKCTCVYHEHVATMQMRKQ